MMEDFKWVNAVIDSCITPGHLEFIPTILDLFDRKHLDTDATHALKAMYLIKEQSINDKHI